MHFKLKQMNTLFLISTKKECNYIASWIDMVLSVSQFTVPWNARVNHNFRMTLDSSHNASVKLKYCTCKSQCSCYMGNHRIVRIVGLIHIHVASLKSVWLPMLHNHVCLLQEAFIHPFYSIVESNSSIYICWNAF